MYISVGKKKDNSKDLDNICPKEVLDDIVNKHGVFFEFLVENKLCILNGRIPGKNDLTYIRPTCKSFGDYFITYSENF